MAVPRFTKIGISHTSLLHCHAGRLLRQQHVVDVAASLKTTVAAAAERSRASVEIGHGHSGTSVHCIKSHASAGHLVVHFVTGPMVGDRRFPGATILGASFSTSSANHHICVPPTGPVRRDGLGCLVVSPCYSQEAPS